MTLSTFTLISGLAFLSSHVNALLPAIPEGVTTIKSKLHHGVSLSYKEPGICETTAGVKSYAGYVHLPPDALHEPHEHNDYPINTFFWFFEARHDPHNTPLAIWLNGGPGASSLIGALSENGPCFVGNDSNSTYLNPWSWNNEVNMLYIDQPVQVGYSYDYLTNVTASLQQDLFSGWEYIPTDFSDEKLPEHNLTFVTGTTGSQNVTYTANTTHHAAVAVWHFAQTWFEEFPHYKPYHEHVSLIAESYGGHYGPAFVAYFMRQNELIANGTISGPGAHYLHMDTLGIVNGCIDIVEQAWAYASFPVNNTYDVVASTDEQYYHAMYELSRDNGIIDQLHECRHLERSLDPDNDGHVEEVNKYCASIVQYFQDVVRNPYLRSRQHDYNDITQPKTNSFPPLYFIAFLNQDWVQKALGVPVNHTYSSPSVESAFYNTGDYAKGDLLGDLAYILDHGVKVAMMYGDRDFACNWVQGEQASLKIPWSSRSSFESAGYTPLVISPLRSGGLTRQYGNLSFTRVYQAGHMTPSYQPEAAYEIFMRALKGQDIATGSLNLQEVAAKDGKQYVTEGPLDTWWKKNDILPPFPHECYYLDPGRCTEEEMEWVMDGSAIVEDWIVVGRDESLVTKRPEIPVADRGQIPLLGDW